MLLKSHTQLQFPISTTVIPVNRSHPISTTTLQNHLFPVRPYRSGAVRGNKILNVLLWLWRRRGHHAGALIILSQCIYGWKRMELRSGTINVKEHMQNFVETREISEKFFFFGVSSHKLNVGKKSGRDLRVRRLLRSYFAYVLKEIDNFILKTIFRCPTWLNLTNEIYSANILVKLQ